MPHAKSAGRPFSARASPLTAVTLIRDPGTLKLELGIFPFYSRRDADDQDNATWNLSGIFKGSGRLPAMIGRIHLKQQLPPSCHTAMATQMGLTAPTAMRILVAMMSR